MLPGHRRDLDLPSPFALHLRLLAQRMKNLIKLHISAIFFCRVVSVDAVTLDLLDCMPSVSLWM